MKWEALFRIQDGLNPTSFRRESFEAHDAAQAKDVALDLRKTLETEGFSVALVGVVSEQHPLGVVQARVDYIRDFLSTLEYNELLILPGLLRTATREASNKGLGV